MALFPGLNVLGNLAGNAQASEPVPPFEAPDLSELSDRQILEATYLEIAQARHLLTAIVKNAANGPLGSFFPKV